MTDLRSDATGEMAEFAGFPLAARVYITMVLDCVLENGAWRDRWRPKISPAMLDRSFANMAMQRELRERLQRFWCTQTGDPEFMPLLMTSAFDLGMGDIAAFSPYRFLAERLYGTEVRPLLPSLFCAAAMMPHIKADMRFALLRTIDEDAVAACGQPARLVFTPVVDAI